MRFSRKGFNKGARRSYDVNARLQQRKGDMVKFNKFGRNNFARTKTRSDDDQAQK